MGAQRASAQSAIAQVHAFIAHLLLLGIQPPAPAYSRLSLQSAEEETMLRTALLFAASVPTAFAQGYPNKPIRLMIGYTAGGSAEAGARPLARALEPLLGQPLVFEYPPGDAGGVAMEAIAQAPAAGYTIYYFHTGPLTVPPHLGKGRSHPF